MNLLKGEVASLEQFMKEYKVRADWVNAPWRALIGCHSRFYMSFEQE
jgi:hypothetical protein